MASQPEIIGSARSARPSRAQRTIRSATSSAVDMGCENTMSGTPSMSSRMNPVLIGPGDTTDALIPLPSSSWAIASVKARSPNLVAL